MEPSKKLSLYIREGSSSTPLAFLNGTKILLFKLVILRPGILVPGQNWILRKAEMPFRWKDVAMRNVGRSHELV